MSLAAFLKPPVKNLSAIQLARLAKLTGVNHAGKTKASTGQSILEAVKNIDCRQNGSKQPLKILSIDMGLQNLAYCRLERLSKESRPIIKDWRKVSVLEPEMATSNKGTAYSNAELARAALRLLEDLVLSKSAKDQPDHILIERQRWRSMGGKNILQWTVRVNTFEAMLWATLHTLGAQGVWSGQVHSVDPARAMSYWFDKGSITSATSNRRYAAVKEAKINLVRGWCTKETHVVSDCGDSQAIFRALQAEETGERKSRISKTLNPSNVKKLDDLADCLIQGVTWLKWLEHKRLLAEKGEAGIWELLQAQDVKICSELSV